MIIAKKSLLLLLFICLTLWTFISVIRSFYSLSKVFTEEKKWIFMNDYQKRSNLYGDIYQIYNSLNEETLNTDNIYLVTNDGKSFFLLRYLLYPKKILWFTSIEKIPLNQHELLLIYHDKPLDKKKFKLIDSFGKGKESAYLYKL